MRLSPWLLALVFSACVATPASVLAETSNEEVAYELKEMRKTLQAQNELLSYA